MIFWRFWYTRYLYKNATKYQVSWYLSSSTKSNKKNEPVELSHGGFTMKKWDSGRINGIS
jgi:hypothetical protein